LNAAAPGNPIILYHEAAMICAVNSKALELAGITEQTDVSPSGTIDKDTETGKLTGILRDSATNLIWQVVPEPTSDELLEATALACQKIAQAGITSVHWMVLAENELSLIQSLHAKRNLLLRVNVIVPETLLEKAVDLKPTNGPMLRLGGAEIAVDGYLDSKTAALSKPYNDEPNSCGRLLLTEQSLADSVEKVLEAGVQPVIHAMGDKAINLALKVIEKSSDKKTRFRMEQAAVLDKELIKGLKKQKIVVSVQPKVIATEFLVWSAIEHLGDQRAKWLHPLKTLLAEGVKVAGGSDCPMEPLNPLLGVQGAVTRQVFPEQRLSIEEALRIYTIYAAFCSCEEKVKGSIEKGKLADLTILSDDPFAISPDEIETVKVDMTIINGKVVYS
jgi:predicted amidohydrolase YtcJ